MYFYRFYTYGDIPLETQLEAIEELGLSRFDKLQIDTEIPREPRWTDPVECSIILVYNKF